MKQITGWLCEQSLPYNYQNSGARVFSAAETNIWDDELIHLKKDVFVIVSETAAHGQLAELFLRCGRPSITVQECGRAEPLRSDKLESRGRDEERKGSKNKT